MFQKIGTLNGSAKIKIKIFNTTLTPPNSPSSSGKKAQIPIIRADGIYNLRYIELGGKMRWPVRPWGSTALAQNS
ncbi:MAG: hypothetical protein LBF22_12730 [Deltaproteobacteria bacterium]|nr:hypothetical protein [Deltaproteobacteria bacterium]